MKMKKCIVTVISTIVVGSIFNQITYADTLYNTNSQEAYYDNYSWDDYAEIPDYQLLTALNKALGHKPNEDILISDLENLKGNINLSNQDIQYLDGLEYLKKVSSIDLSGNKIRYLNDYTFSDLKNLKKLNLSNNSIIDISPLKNLTNLESLNLSHQIHPFIRNTYSSIEYIDNNTMTNEVRDENNKIIPISNKNIYLRDGYEENLSKITYNSNTRKIHWTYDAFNGFCGNPWQPIVIFNKDVTIGKAKAKFNGAFYMSLENSHNPDNIQDNYIHYKASKLLDNLNNNKI